MFSELCSRVWIRLYFSLLRPMIKWLTHRITGKCELLRIVYQYPEGAVRTKHIEKCLERSRSAQLKKLIRDYDYDIDEAVQVVIKFKNILLDIHIEFDRKFKICLQHICAYNRLHDEVEALRKIKYDSENPAHEKLLLELWKLLMPNEELEGRISNQWCGIGFQGNDPATDFRGMGLLGLQQLLYFARHYSILSQECLSKSHHPKIGLSYAIVGVNITGMTHHLLKKRKLRSHFYSSPSHSTILTLNDFHEVYCYLFYEFDKFWYQQKPKTIMDFSSVKDKFQKKILSRLKETGVRLEITQY